MKQTRLCRSKVERLLARASALELSDEARQKLRWFLFAAEHDGNASLTCRHFGIARTTYALWLRRFDPEDPRTLEEASRRPHRVRQPRTDARTVAMVADLRRQSPTMNKETISSILSGNGIAASPSTVGRIISRHRLFFGERPSHEQKRMKAENNANPPPSLFPFAQRS